jgi:hypothetical protein
MAEAVRRPPAFGELEVNTGMIHTVGSYPASAMEKVDKSPDTE